MRIDLPTLVATHHAVTQLEQLGDEIAELAANLDAATARLLELLPRGADRPRMASDGAAGRDPGGGPAVCGPGAPRRPRRGWQRGDSRAADAGDRCAAPAQQPADALALIAETALHQTLDPGAPGERYQVVVHVDATVLEDPAQPGQTALEGGIRISAETSRRLACDASRVVMRHDQDGQLVEIGARTRIIPPDLRRALHYRDRPCRFPGCGARIGQGHHVQHWSNGGPTRLTNLVLLCRRHHRAVHEEGYQVAREPDGTFHFRRPDGSTLQDVPEAATVTGDPVRSLQAANEVRRPRIHARTGCPPWLGERLDVGWAIDVLHPRAAPIGDDPPNRLT